MDVPDPLLPLPEATIEVALDLSGEERLAALLTAAIDHVNLHAMAWPAKDRDGQLVPPPDEHVLHELAHECELADEERLMISPRLGTVGFLSKLPGCDFCGMPARYDAAIAARERRTWANMCSQHYVENGSGTLGTSHGAYLMLWSEVPRSVQATCNQIRQAQGKDPVF